MADAIFSIKNFAQFQHYKDRDPPWVKLHRNTITGKTWIKGNDLSRSIQLASILLAARYNNQIPFDFDMLQPLLALRCTEKEFMQAMKHLEASEYIEINNLDLCYQDASKPLATCTPEAEAEAEAESTLKKGAPKKTRLPETWTPTQEDIDYARQQNLTDADIAREARNFVRYWTGPDAKNPRKSDWHRTWCNRIDDIAGRIVANRNLARQPNGYRQGRGGIVSAVSQLLVEENGPMDDDSTLFKQRFAPQVGSQGRSDFGGNGGIIIEADVTKPHTEAVGGVEIHHAAKGGG